MARYPGLILRKARWYLRCYVPVDLVEFLGRDEVWRSLGTGDHSLAVRRYRRARADLDQWFDAQRRRRDARERINGEVPRLVTEWFRAAEHRALHTDFDLTGEPLQEALAETEQHLFELSGGEADEQVSAVVDQILISSGWPARQHSVGTIRTRHLTPDGELPPSIHALARRALIEGARRRITRLRGQPAQPVDPVFRVQPVSPDQITIGERAGLTPTPRHPRTSPPAEKPTRSS